MVEVRVEKKKRKAPHEQVADLYFSSVEAGEETARKNLDEASKIVEGIKDEREKFRASRVLGDFVSWMLVRYPKKSDTGSARES